MRELLRELEINLQSQTAVVVCRLVETRGSTPQKAGASMLVYADGTQHGTLGGGCVEAEVKRRAFTTLQNQCAEISTFQLDSDFGWDDGLICGGRMIVLIEPILPGLTETVRYYQAVCEGMQDSAGCTEAIAFDAACNLATPALFLLDATGNCRANLHHSGSLPAVISAGLRSLSQRPRAYVHGGVAYLPCLPRCRLLIVGGGHVGQSVAKLAASLEFDIWVIDDREDIISAARFPDAERRLSGDMEQLLQTVEITPDTFCIIVTRGHQHDEEALYRLVNRSARYVGLIGSRRKIKLIFEDLLERGVTREALQRVYAPLGIEIGSQTVPEIAVSICAELVAFRNLGRVPGRPPSVEIK